jgi:hypothetical protein
LRRGVAAGGLTRRKAVRPLGPAAPACRLQLPTAVAPAFGHSGVKTTHRVSLLRLRHHRFHFIPPAKAFHYILRWSEMTVS